MYPALRPATPADEPFLRELFHQVHAPEFEALNLPQQALLPLLDLQFRGQTLTYAAGFPNAHSQIVLVDGTPGGRLLTAFQPEALHLIDIALLPHCRGQGIGTYLLAQLIAQAADLPIRLQVRPGNPALRLYQRHGFLQTTADATTLHLERPANPSNLIAHSS